MAEPVRAVVFDLWETLIPLPPDLRAAAFAETCAALGMTPAAMRPHWDDTRARRETGDLADYLRWLGRRLGTPWEEATIGAAVAARIGIHGQCFADRYRDGEQAVEAIRRRGLATALVSNCSSDVRQMLRASDMESWFDHIVLSAETESAGRLMKPDPAIYRMACDGLGIEPAGCLYIGDGGDRELDGAAAIGMRPLLYDRRAGAGIGAESRYPVLRSHLELLDRLP